MIIDNALFSQTKLLFRQANRLKPNVLAAMDKVVWFICTARNAIVVIACLIIASVLDPDIEECMLERENCTFTLTGKIECGLGTLGVNRKHMSTSEKGPLCLVLKSQGGPFSDVEMCLLWIPSIPIRKRGGGVNSIRAMSI